MPRATARSTRPAGRDGPSSQEQALLERLARLFPAGGEVLLGPGDDCAVLRAGSRRTLVTTDVLVEGVHFRRSWMTPRQIGRRAYLVSASDIAAMGGRPTACVVSAGVPPGLPDAELIAMHRGIAEAAARGGARVAGGNLSRSATLFLSLTVLGGAPRRPLLRSGARPGDLLWVTGRLGEAALGVRRLAADPRARGPAVRRYREPQPRLAAGEWLAREVRATAAIDISDGLVLDVERICRASGVAAVVHADRIPMSPEVRRTDPTLALAGGEDYELAFTVPRSRARRLRRAREAAGCPVTCIGEIVPGPPRVTVLGEDGRPLRLRAGGYDAFGEGGA